MVRALLIAAVLVSGCVIRSTRARDATLHYHPTLDELRAAPAIRSSAPPAARTVAVKLVFDGVASAYPQPIGLDYDDDGGYRTVIGVQWGHGELERALSTALPAAWLDGDGETAHVRGAVVNLAVYRFGSEVYARALLDLRVARDGSEVYAARYTASLRGSDREQLLAALTSELVGLVTRDDGLVAALAGGAS